MIQMRFVPVETWPGQKTANRKPHQFRSTYPQTLDLLEEELKHLKAKEIVLQAYIGWDDLRNDGLPRGNANFTEPGVILTFESSKGTLSFPCDRYTDWVANIRGIALSLEALRAVDRHGVTRRAEQYQGWKKLAPPSDHMDRETAAMFLVAHALDRAPTDSELKLARESAGYRQQCYERAAKRLHPDIPGGCHEDFVKLQTAIKVLGVK